MLSPAPITPLPVKTLCNFLAANAPNKIEKNPPLSYFVSFLIVSLTPSINNPDLRDLIIFIISFIFHSKLLIT